jgi:FAD/FMN-containing dehydrogenase/Fe-S oxidoreductase
MKNIFSRKDEDSKITEGNPYTQKKDKVTGKTVFHGDTKASLPVEVNISELENELKAAITGEVRFDNGSRALYATDASNYRQVPIGVILPRNKEDVILAVAVCNKFQVPITGRGGGTSLAGQGCNVAVIIDMSKYMNKVISIDPHRKLARIQPGIILDDLRNAAEQYHLTFGPDPATHRHCTLGGMIGNNSCGVHSVMAGRTADNIEELEILTYDGLQMTVGKTPEANLEKIIAGGGRKGAIYLNLKELRDNYTEQVRNRYPKIPRRVSGYNLDELLPENCFNVARALVGSESTCVIVLEATVNLVESPPGRSLVVLGYPDIFTAADHVPEIMKFKPVGLEGVDDHLVKDMIKKGLHTDDLPFLPEGKGWLMVEFGGRDKEDSDRNACKLIEAIKAGKQGPTYKLYDNPEDELKLWEIRESGLGATARIPGQPDTWEGWEDSAVPPEKEGKYLRELKKLFDKYGYAGALYGHFGQGCIHTRITFDLVSAEGIKKYRSFMDEATSLVVSYGGSLSGEHGDGQSRAEFLPKMYGPELIKAFNEFKYIWDPDWKMNPGKIVRPYKIDENLRLGKDYRPWEPETQFKYPGDKGSFSRAVLRCVGVGKCRNMDVRETETMCPSFRVTREEKHSTRGRARLLFEMLRGDELNGWKDENVKEALDLCLACKGCKNDCPVSVDMATYKAEFLSHYYKGKIRPRQAYAFGLIFRWSRLATHIPWLVNFVTQTAILSNFAKMAAGIAPQRQIPRFANQNFKDWFKNRKVVNAGKEKVILWADTFNNYFHPQIAEAAVAVLEDAGYQVLVLQENVCCGRPLYDYGMLDLAKIKLEEILKAMRPYLSEGIPVVGLEPSCTAVFRDELLQLFPTLEDAKRLNKSVFTLGEFLEKIVKDYQVPKLDAKVLIQAHCHHKSVMKISSEQVILKKMGTEAEIIPSGCCGMAGAFGFEKEHYEVSMACGEEKLFPRVRNAGKETLIVADGFSCRTQIEQGSERKAFHLAEILKIALKNEHLKEPGRPLEKIEKQKQNKKLLRIGVITGIGILGSLLYLNIKGKNS